MRINIEVVIWEINRISRQLKYCQKLELSPVQSHTELLPFLTCQIWIYNFTTAEDSLSRVIVATRSTLRGTSKLKGEGNMSTRIVVLAFIAFACFGNVLVLADSAHADVLPPRPKPAPRPPKPQPPLPKPLPPMEEDDALSDAKTVMIGLTAHGFVISLGVWLIRTRHHTRRSPSPLRTCDA
jgi:hypothetical protein